MSCTGGGRGVSWQQLQRFLRRAKPLPSAAGSCAHWAGLDLPVSASFILAPLSSSTLYAPVTTTNGVIASEYGAPLKVRCVAEE